MAHAYRLVVGLCSFNGQVGLLQIWWLCGLATLLLWQLVVLVVATSGGAGCSVALTACSSGSSALADRVAVVLWLSCARSFVLGW